jgi:hypothetical protein
LPANIRVVRHGLYLELGARSKGFPIDRAAWVRAPTVPSQLPLMTLKAASAYAPNDLRNSCNSLHQMNAMGFATQGVGEDGRVMCRVRLARGGARGRETMCPKRSGIIGLGRVIRFRISARNADTSS